MLPLITKAVSFLSTIATVSSTAKNLLGIKPVKRKRPTIRKQRMKAYTATGVELANAFARARYFLENTNHKKFHTIGAAIRYGIGHNTRVQNCALGLVNERVDWMSASDWLIKNGVPKEEVTGLKGKKNLLVWKKLWLEKLENEFANDDSKYTYKYPF